MGSVHVLRSVRFQIGVVGYEAAADDGEDRADDFAGNIDGTLRRQLARVRRELGLSEAKSELWA